MTSPTHAIEWGRLMLTAGLLGVVLTPGCGRDDGDAARNALSALELHTDTPDQAARGLLELLDLTLAHRPGSSGDLAEAFAKRTLEVVDADAVYARYRRNTIQRLERGEVVAQMVSNWASVIAQQRSAFDFGAMRISAGATATDPTLVDIPSTDPETRAVLRVACVRTDDGWRVAGVEWVGPDRVETSPRQIMPPSSQPIAAPTTP